tara:strand:- start:32123 stop:32245 length:123 start_codon:yes stop_codon:yes gene_type:complete
LKSRHFYLHIKKEVEDVLSIIDRLRLYTPQKGQEQKAALE